MKLTVFAATGGIGRQMLAQAVDAGHDVTAVVRSAGPLPRNVPTIAVDLAAPDASLLESAVRGADAVLSGLGARTAADVGIAEKGTLAIVRAMDACGVKRIVVVSAAPVSTVPSPGRPDPPRHDPGDGLVMRYLLAPLIKAALREHYTDLARMEDVLRASDVDWTIVRPPRLTNGPLTGGYRTARGRNVRGGVTVSRADVAHMMIQVLGQPDANRQVFGIAR